MKNDILKYYQQAINQIDDFLEYRYKSFDSEGIKNEIIKIIDGLTKDLKDLNHE